MPKKSTQKAPAKASAAKTAARPKKAKAKDDGDSNGTGKSLVIVESPAKAKTLKKILGSGYRIKASVGHVRDLPRKKIGVDVDNNFEPVYEVLEEKQDVVKDLREAARKSDRVYLAADPDREGEAIAWHVYTLLQKPDDQIFRIEFNEITKKAILEAIEHPRPIDLNRVNAQQARRILDRLVGYKLSPLLWKKVTKGLSAGRVQSVAVRLICDREAEIEAFTPEEYWNITADLFSEKDASVSFEARLVKIDGESIKDDNKTTIKSEAEATKIVDALKTNPYAVSALNTRESSRKASPPFITSTLQREASTRFGYPVKRTMQIAQQLYEGTEIGDEGPVGLITYMRTDSTRIADEARDEAKELIVDRFGADHYPETPNVYLKKTKKNVQDAHEAIRPTSVFRTPEMVKPYLKDDQFRLYKIIWDRFVASQMVPARIKTKSIEAACANYTLRASHSEVIFKGYMAVYKTEEDEGPDEKALPELNQGDALKARTVEPRQHFTEPPPRYNEASLVKTLEELGIGRPSTYAPTIATVQDRGYVIKDNNALKPTELGKTVNMLLVKHFTDIVDVNFTANLENRLDEIADDNVQWQGVVRDFYEPFATTLKKASDEMEKVQILIEGENCPDCGLPMALKTSRWGSQFLGCTGYPECKKTKPLTKDMQPAPEDKPTEEKCEKCGGEMVIKYGRFGEYLKCQDEECKATRSLEVKTGVTCPKCGKGDIVQKKSRRGKIFFGCNQYPNCDQAFWKKPINEECPECGKLLTENVLKKGTFIQCSDTKGCGYKREVEPAATEA